MDLISIQISLTQIALASNIESVAAMTLKLQEVANLGMLFHVMQTIHFIHVCIG